MASPIFRCVLVFCVLLMTCAPRREAAASPGFRPTRDMNVARWGQTMTELVDGRVLIAGGTAGAFAPTTASAEVLDLATRTWTPAADMNVARAEHAATLLPDGRVLVTGGVHTDDIASSPTPTLRDAEVFDPKSGTWTAVAPMRFPRRSHTATLVGAGVLVAGGADEPNTGTDTAELFDLATQTWMPVVPMSTPRHRHTATLLQDGRVLVAGGRDASGTPTASAELFDPSTRAWIDDEVPPMRSDRAGHTATLLHDGRVLVLGGVSYTYGGLPTSVEVLDLQAKIWLDYDHASIDVGRQDHTATLLGDGRVLVAGGDDWNDPSALDDVEVFDAALGQWSPAPQMPVPRAFHTAALLRDGRVLVAGGWTINQEPSKNAELLDIDAGRFHSLADTGQPRAHHTATQLDDGRVLVAGGDNYLVDSAENGSAELFDPSNDRWQRAPRMSSPRAGHTATRLGDGPGRDRRVLVAGGVNGSEALASAELFDPDAGSWRAAPDMLARRASHAAVLLRDGRVLVAGGEFGDLHETIPEAEVFDARRGSWVKVAPMSTSRAHATATRLDDGRVLVVGGRHTTSLLEEVLGSAELFDPETGTWTPAPDLHESRALHTATRLDDGRILVTGGVHRLISGWPTIVASAEVFDPRDGTWTVVPTMSTARALHAATSLPGGHVLVTGGNAEGSPSLLTHSSAEVFDPRTLSWTQLDDMRDVRAAHTAMWLNDGRVLVLGGTFGNALDSSEVNVGLGTAEVLGDPRGIPCDQPVTCRSGACVDGFCCDSACDDASVCTACSLLTSASADGACTPVEDCAPYACSRSAARLASCLSSCTTAEDCAPGLACDLAGRCAAPRNTTVDTSCGLASTGPAAPAPGRAFASGALLLAALGAWCRRRRGERAARPWTVRRRPVDRPAAVRA